MRINLTRDIDVFLASAGRWLTKNPVGNNVLLTTIAAQHAGHVKGDESALYGWAEDRGEILGALRWPPPLPATLTVMPPAAAGALAAALVERSAPLPGVNGPLEAVSAFADRWTQLTGLAAWQNRELVISLLREVRLTQWPSGRMRNANESEAPVLAGWIAAVLAQAGLPSAEQTARQQIDDQLAGGRLYVWEVGGQLAAVTGHAAPAENVVLVHGGFASPDHRDSWYGTAIVAAVCRHLLGQGYSCISITDRGNPHTGATLRHRVRARDESYRLPVRRPPVSLRTAAPRADQQSGGRPVPGRPAAWMPRPSAIRRSRMARSRCSSAVSDEQQHRLVLRHGDPRLPEGLPAFARQEQRVRSPAARLPRPRRACSAHRTGAAQVPAARAWRRTHDLCFPARIPAFMIVSNRNILPLQSLRRDA